MPRQIRPNVSRSALQVSLELRFLDHVDLNWSLNAEVRLTFLSILECNEFCEDCVTSANPWHCTRCKKGNFLEYLSSDVTFGFCRPKNV